MRPVFLSVVVAVMVAATPALAHKVIASVFRSGNAVEGEIGFSNGDMAVEQLVEVFDETGTKIGEAVTDRDGFFTYTPTAAVTHVFRADLGAGHVAEATMEAAEIALVLGKGPAPDAAQSIQPSAGISGDDAAVAVIDAEARAVIAEAVRDEIRPLRREIAAYKEKNDLQTILGGIGYIVGLFGVGFYLAARRKLQA